MPPNGTAGLARWAVRGMRRLPSPPARTMARTRGAAMPEPYGHVRGWAMVERCPTDVRLASGRRPSGGIGAALPRTSPGAASVTVAGRTGPPGAGRTRVRVDLLTREYPPHVYGGAGVHVTELARALPGAAADLDVRVRCLDGPRTQDGVTGYTEPADLAGVPPLGTLAAGLGMARDVAGADLVHSHTWYANLAGHVAG